MIKVCSSCYQPKPITPSKLSSIIKEMKKFSNKALMTIQPQYNQHFQILQFHRVIDFWRKESSSEWTEKRRHNFNIDAIRRTLDVSNIVSIQSHHFWWSLHIMRRYFSHTWETLFLWNRGMGSDFLYFGVCAWWRYSNGIYHLWWWYDIWNYYESLIYYHLYSYMEAGQSIVDKSNEDDI